MSAQMNQNHNPVELSSLERAIVSKYDAYGATVPDDAPCS